MTPESELTARAYLLGELQDARVAVLEQALLTDPALLDHVQQVENDLVDDYVDDRLSSDDRTRFEAYYLASQVHRDRVALSRTLTAVAHAAPETTRVRNFSPRPRTLAWAGLAAALVLVAGWLAIRQAPRAPGIQTSPAVAEAPSQPAPPVAEPAPSSTAPVRVALLLAPVTTRSRSTTPRVVVPADAGFIDLRLDGPRSPRAGAAAIIRSVDDRLAWTGTAEPASDRLPAGVPAHAWVVSVPADRLAADDYILTLSDAGSQVLARYFFRITRER